MGAYLSQPITDKESSDGEDGRFKYGTTAMQGWRTNMEVRERDGIGRRLCRSRPASRRRPRVANGEISVTFRADTRLARGRFRAAAARSPDPSLSRRRSPNPPPAFDRRTRTPRFSAWTKTPPSSACTTGTAARRCVRRPRLVRSHPTWLKGALFFRARIAYCFFLVARATRPVSESRITNPVADRSLLSRTRSMALAADDDDVSVTPRSRRDPTATRPRATRDDKKTKIN